MRGGFNFSETHIITTHMNFCCEGRGRNNFFSEERVIIAEVFHPRSRGHLRRGDWTPLIIRWNGRHKSVHRNMFQIDNTRNGK